MSTSDRNTPETPATKFLKKHGIPFSAHRYAYEEHGGTRVSARELNVAEHAVIKTLVMENEAGEPVIVLMHGDRKVSTKELARQAGCKQMAPCKPEVAQRHTGYMVGGTSPFGDPQDPARVHGKNRAGPPAHLYQWRTAGFSGRHPPSGYCADTATETRPRRPARKLNQLND